MYAVYMGKKCRNIPAKPPGMEALPSTNYYTKLRL